MLKLLGNLGSIIVAVVAISLVLVIMIDSEEAFDTETDSITLEVKLVDVELSKDSWEEFENSERYISFNDDIAHLNIDKVVYENGMVQITADHNNDVHFRINEVIRKLHNNFNNSQNGFLGRY